MRLNGMLVDNILRPPQEVNYNDAHIIDCLNWSTRYPIFSSMSTTQEFIISLLAEANSAKCQRSQWRNSELVA
jgi:hypothetical protein